MSHYHGELFKTSLFSLASNTSREKHELLLDLAKITDLRMHRTLATEFPKTQREWAVERGTPRRRVRRIWATRESRRRRERAGRHGQERGRGTRGAVCGISRGTSGYPQYNVEVKTFGM